MHDLLFQISTFLLLTSCFGITMAVLFRGQKFIAQYYIMVALTLANLFYHRDSIAILDPNSFSTKYLLLNITALIFIPTLFQLFDPPAFRFKAHCIRKIQKHFDLLAHDPSAFESNDPSAFESKDPSSFESNDPSAFENNDPSFFESTNPLGFESNDESAFESSDECLTKEETEADMRETYKYWNHIIKCHNTIYTMALIGVGINLAIFMSKL